MEYLSIKGSVHIRKEIAAVSLFEVIASLVHHGFESEGLVSYQFDFETLELTLDAEGPVSAEVTEAVNKQLVKLREMITPDSRIAIERVRWEVNVTLSTQVVPLSNSK